MWDVESGKRVETVLEIETGFGFVEAVMYSPATGGGSELESVQANLQLASIFK